MSWLRTLLRRGGALGISITASVLVMAAGTAAQADQIATHVSLASYRIPDRFLTIETAGHGSIGYGYPPAYGFDTANHNIQCTVIQGEDGTTFACGVQARAWTPKRCASSTYTGVEGYVGAYANSAAVTCTSLPIVPRERKRGSTATSGSQVNRVLPAGATITAFHVSCTASGSGRASTVTCRSHIPKATTRFSVSYGSLTTHN